LQRKKNEGKIERDRERKRGVRERELERAKNITVCAFSSWLHIPADVFA
jgi:hypothetical protein